jgi:signal peptidase I
MDRTVPENPLPAVVEETLPIVGAATSQPESPSTRRIVLKVLLGLLALNVLVAVVLRVFVLAAFYAPSVSMAPTINRGDRFLVNRLAYRFGDVERGDIVVFKRPPGEPDPSIKDLVKRVIGLPGDEVSFQDGTVLVNGTPLVEPYVPPGMRTEARRVDVIKVPAGHVLVLGDNRTNSTDSRVFGTFDTSLIVGEVFYTFRFGPQDP